MIGVFQRALRTGLAWVPSLAPARAARALVLRANAARDARRFQAAAALYAEASRLDPVNARIHKQCGHMHKEAGDWAEAERHYLLAEALSPGDADLHLQKGHFFKISHRLDEAQSAYAKALALQPGWQEAADELARITNSRSKGDERTSAINADGLVTELLPGSGAQGSAGWRETIQIRRLGTARIRAGGSYRRVLRGIEAVRGFAISQAALLDAVLLLDGEEIADTLLQRTPLNDGFAKFVFNIWHDFGPYAEGEHVIEIRLRDSRGRGRSHRATLLLQAPITEKDALSSDAIVTVDGEVGASLEARVNARPSMARSAARGLLVSPPRAILVQRVDQLGDLVVSVPAIRRLRAHFPEAVLVALVSPANAGLAASLGLFAEVVEVPFAEAPGGPRRTMPPIAQAALRERLASFHFDIAIDLSEAGESRPLLLLSGASVLFGFKDREFPWLTAGFELGGHDPANHLEIVSPATKLTAMVDALKLMIDPPASALALSPEKAEAERRYAVLHTGARLTYSRWPGFAELAHLLLRDTELDIVFMSDGPLPPDLVEHPRVRSIEGLLAFSAFDALLAGASLFVGNDSGPKHLAALRGTPVVSLHMARLNWNEWGQEPVGTIISRRVPCAGCGIGRQGEECGKDFACLTNIRADEVAAEALKLLK